MSSGYSLKQSETLLQQYHNGREVQDINDIIELHNIIRFFDNDMKPKDWTPDYFVCLSKIAKSYLELIARFFYSLTEEDFENRYNEVDVLYKDNFWELIQKFKVHEKISPNLFNKLINKSEVWLHQLLEHSCIVERFGPVIKDYMLDNAETAELLLDQYEMKHINEQKQLHFPRELSNADKEKIINNYIDSDNPNLNYLRLISNIQSRKDVLEISPKTLLQSRKKEQELENRFFQNNPGMKIETRIAFSKSQQEEIAIEINDQCTSLSYGTKWIEDNQDYPTLLNNFIYLFEFVDIHMRCALVSKLNQMNVFERLMLSSSRNAYLKGLVFDQLNTISLLQLNGYYNELFSLGIRLEAIIEWFFKKYLADEFDAHSFRVSMPSPTSTIHEKCVSIIPAFEYTLKQFTSYVEEGQIDPELLEIRSGQLVFKNIPSLVDKKYVYGVGDEFKTATFLLFSDQSGIRYYPKEKKSYANFYDLLSKAQFRLDDFSEYFRMKIMWLSDKKYLTTNAEGYVVSRDENLFIILQDLFYNDVISYWQYSLPAREIINSLENNRLVRFESSLFSQPEQDYINFFLNKSQFNNGLDLRNKYVHTQFDADEDKHQISYMIFLRLFVISVIKINDDFCTADKIKKMNNDPQYNTRGRMNSE